MMYKRASLVSVCPSLKINRARSSSGSGYLTTDSSSLFQSRSGIRVVRKRSFTDPESRLNPSQVTALAYDLACSVLYSPKIFYS